MNYSTDTDYLRMSSRLTVRRWRQPVLVIIISLLLHLFVFDWLAERPSKVYRTTPVEQVIVASLLPPATPAPVQPVVVAARPVPAPPAPRRVAPRRTTVKIARAAPVVEPVDVTPIDEALPADPSPQPQAEVPVQPETTTDPVDAAPPAEAAVPNPTPAPVLHFAPPPSAELKYDVQALRDGKIVYGNGKISWKKEGNNYEIDGEAGILFFSVLTFKSEGSLDEQGITPLRYSEKRFRKSATNTHFQRDPKRISFSASTMQYPRSGGEQDRASIIWQLAALGRADPAQFGDGLDIFVAGVRDGDTWHVQVLGQEQITVGGAVINAWHLLRTPRAGSFDTQVDIWLAPTRDWYPVKLRQTERNGDYLDMSMSSITALSAQ